MVYQYFHRTTLFVTNNEKRVNFAMRCITGVYLIIYKSLREKITETNYGVNTKI